LAVRSDLFRPGVRPAELGAAVAARKVRFLNVSELGARKNLAGLLGVWLRATTPADDAVLIMKVGCYSAGSRARLEAEVVTAQRRAGKTLDDAAPVHFVFDILPDVDMPRLYAAATHYISLSFGEGWDLPMMEAAASGLQLIAPGHSGYLAYLDGDIARLVTSREVPVVTGDDFQLNELFQGAAWWQPDEDEAIAAIRDAIAGRQLHPLSARERIAGDFTWERAARRLLDIIDEAEATAGAPSTR
jgi:glycosyltransferase involved in cell wall biosynthesis